AVVNQMTPRRPMGIMERSQVKRRMSASKDQAEMITLHPVHDSVLLVGSRQPHLYRRKALCEDEEVDFAAIRGGRSRVKARSSSTALPLGNLADWSLDA
uniref:Uncharacterized protein n=1 Tax=Cannabis sativa TaxID=3483 RepID=A0A803QS00_CANSA